MCTTVGGSFLLGVWLGGRKSLGSVAEYHLIVYNLLQVSFFTFYFYEYILFIDLLLLLK